MQNFSAFQVFQVKTTQTETLIIRKLYLDVFTLQKYAENLSFKLCYPKNRNV